MFDRRVARIAMSRSDVEHMFMCFCLVFCAGQVFVLLVESKAPLHFPEPISVCIQEVLMRDNVHTLELRDDIRVDHLPAY